MAASYLAIQRPGARACPIRHCCDTVLRDGLRINISPSLRKGLKNYVQCCCMSLARTQSKVNTLRTQSKHADIPDVRHPIVARVVVRVISIL